MPVQTREIKGAEKREASHHEGDFLDQTLYLENRDSGARISGESRILQRY